MLIYYVSIVSGNYKTLRQLHIQFETSILRSHLSRFIATRNLESAYKNNERNSLKKKSMK